MKRKRKNKKIKIKRNLLIKMLFLIYNKMKLPGILKILLFLMAKALILKICQTNILRMKVF